MSETDEGGRRGRTRERLMDAAFEVFADVGVQAASVEQLSEAAGFSRGAFYSNFSSKEELFFALLAREHHRQLGAMEQRMQEAVPRLAADPLDVEAVAQTVLEVLQKDHDGRRWCLVQHEFAAMALRDADIGAAYAANRIGMIREVTALVEAAVGSLGLRFTADAELIVDTCAWIYDGALTSGLIAGRALEQIDGGVTTPIAVLLLGATAPA